MEDEAQVRQVVADILRFAGFRVLEAADGAEALEFLQGGADLGLLFTDIRMPGIDGFELAEMAQVIRPDLRVLFTTGYSARCPRPGMVLLRKPYRIRQLLTAIQQVLQGGESAGPSWSAPTGPRVPEML